MKTASLGNLLRNTSPSAPVANCTAQKPSRLGTLSAAWIAPVNKSALTLTKSFKIFIASILVVLCSWRGRSLPNQFVTVGKRDLADTHIGCAIARRETDDGDVVASFQRILAPA